MTTVQSTNPRTGRSVEIVAQESSQTQVQQACEQAARAAPALEDLGRAGRAGLLRALADALEARRADIIDVAERETALGQVRLGGELTRSCYQLRMFAEVLEEGSYIEAAIDRARNTAMGARPDLRRMLVPIGPVAVFGASNFPLAFSVPGGDTASALAAGCPVLLKVHGSHPATSELCAHVMRNAARQVGLLEPVLQTVHGQKAGLALVTDPLVRAVGFTGSLDAGKVLLSSINARSDPIPFYGELSSLNPLIVTPTAAAERAGEIGHDLAGSFLMGAGQFCTKPGLAFVPAGADGDLLVTELSEVVTQTGSQWLLNKRITDSFQQDTARLTGRPDVTVLARGAAASSQGFQATPVLLGADAHQLPHDMLHEHFGPLLVVARYRDQHELVDALAALPASLTTTVHAGDGEHHLPALLTSVLRSRTGRFIFNAYPTGVAVSWAQHHGGPWPSTNTSHTSVGASAIRRFLRPVAFQSTPAELLPEELREDGPAIPRRVDGVLHAPTAEQTQ